MNLNDRIRHFYDRSTPLWLEVWGEHMHHGYYGPDGRERKSHRQAQVDLLEALLEWGGIPRAERLFDAGCGVGGSARYLAKKWNAQALGFTLSPVQAQSAKTRNIAAGLDDRVRVKTRDMLSLRADEGPFDLVWSLESAEHIADKRRILQVFFEALRPGGRLMLVTWCRRREPPLSAKEEALLERIYRHYHLPPMVSIEQYAEWCEAIGYDNVRIADWSQAVAPFWPAVIRSTMSWRSVLGLLLAGRSTIRGAWAMRHMRRGYRWGTIRFGLLQAIRP
jgi:tocopherol O-methyltransferase